MYARFGYFEMQARLRVYYGRKIYHYAVTVRDTNGYDILINGVWKLFIQNSILDYGDDNMCSCFVFAFGVCWWSITWPLDWTWWQKRGSRLALNGLLQQNDWCTWLSIRAQYYVATHRSRSYLKTCIPHYSCTIITGGDEDRHVPCHQVNVKQGHAKSCWKRSHPARQFPMLIDKQCYVEECHSDC